MNFALNEVEATAKKATRGVRYSWGMAEEAGKATRWLCAHGFDGPKALVKALEFADQARLDDLAPVSLQGDWHSHGGYLCALTTGAAMADSALLWAKHGLVLRNVIAPAMILPFAAVSARLLGLPVAVTWGGTSMVFEGSAVSLETSAPEALLQNAALMNIQTGGQLGGLQALQKRANPAEQDWDTLNRFAARIYAPATEESRLKGAGAGLSDND